MEAWQEGRCHPWSPQCVGWGERHELGVCHRAVPASMGAWAQVAPCCLHREPWAGIPSPSPPVLSALPWRCQSQPIGCWGLFSELGSWVVISDTQCWSTGLPLGTGTVLTVCSPSENPSSYSREPFKIFSSQFWNFSALLEILFSLAIQLEFLVWVEVP